MLFDEKHVQTRNALLKMLFAYKILFHNKSKWIYLIQAQFRYESWYTVSTPFLQASGR